MLCPSREMDGWMYIRDLCTTRVVGAGYAYVMILDQLINIIGYGYENGYGYGYGL